MEQEKLIQLAVHLRGKAQQEWDLLKSSSKLPYCIGIEALGNKLNLEGKAVATQDFCHMSQRAGETLSEFISFLERSFREAYGHESMSTNTRSTLLYGQLHERLHYNLMKAPAVSGATRQLCEAARSEEGWQLQLARRQHYQSMSVLRTLPPPYLRCISVRFSVFSLGVAMLY